MFIAALVAVAKTWKQPKCPSTDDWFKKLCYRHTMKYIKNSEILPFAAPWLDLEDIIRSEVRQRTINTI